ncbi:hypothetical protein K431DRAFT_80391 [Polychaeton citri CBS 116435]|uniref:Uncharacterized protein n=1 Tax=Polychaeton citri CBS 116435 TaxID=1314669 RepID=A0A9P4QIX7_9PEZI|nr:hypothetical protein K431DRAFT_80391 [Polychaeton citri CBS 116435]
MNEYRAQILANARVLYSMTYNRSAPSSIEVITTACPMRASVVVDYDHDRVRKWLFMAGSDASDEQEALKNLLNLTSQRLRSYYDNTRFLIDHPSMEWKKAPQGWYQVPKTKVAPPPSVMPKKDPSTATNAIAIPRRDLGKVETGPSRPGDDAVTAQQLSPEVLRYLTSQALLECCKMQFGTAISPS